MSQIKLKGRQRWSKKDRKEEEKWTGLTGRESENVSCIGF